MKTQTKLIIGIGILAIILCLIGALGWSKLRIQKLKNKHYIEQLKDKEQLIAIQAGVIAAQQKLENVPPILDSILKVYDLKLKNVETVTNIYHETIYDTVKTEKEEFKEGESVIQFNFDTNCIQGEGFIDFSQTSIIPTKEDHDNLDIYLTNISYTDTTTTIYFYDRKRVKLFFITLKIGRKQFFAKTTSSCNKGDIKTEFINFKKQ